LHPFASWASPDSIFINGVHLNIDKSYTLYSLHVLLKITLTTWNHPSYFGVHLIMNMLFSIILLRSIVLWHINDRFQGWLEFLGENDVIKILNQSLCFIFTIYWLTSPFLQIVDFLQIDVQVQDKSCCNYSWLWLSSI
jgi:hypothetical protein